MGNRSSSSKEPLVKEELLILIIKLKPELASEMLYFCQKSTKELYSVLRTIIYEKPLKL
jgi:hypothetical protein